MSKKNEKLLFWMALISAIGTVIQTAFSIADHLTAWFKH